MATITLEGLCSIVGSFAWHPDQTDIWHEDGEAEVLRPAEEALRRLAH